MALTATLTKMFPTEDEVGINLVLTDDDRDDLEPIGPGTKTVLTQTFSAQYVTGQDMSNEVRDELGKRAQEAIDRYKMLRARFINPVYDTKVGQIQGALDVT